MSRQPNWDIDKFLADAARSVTSRIGARQIAADTEAELLARSNLNVNAFMNEYWPRDYITGGHPREDQPGKTAAPDPLPEVLSVLRFCLHHMRDDHKQLALDRLQRALGEEFDQ